MAELAAVTLPTWIFVLGVGAMLGCALLAGSNFLSGDDDPTTRAYIPPPVVMAGQENAPLTEVRALLPVGVHTVTVTRIGTAMWSHARSPIPPLLDPDAGRRAD